MRIEMKIRHIILIIGVFWSLVGPEIVFAGKNSDNTPNLQQICEWTVTGDPLKGITASQGVQERFESASNGKELSAAIKQLVRDLDQNGLKLNAEDILFIEGRLFADLANLDKIALIATQKFMVLHSPRNKQFFESWESQIFKHFKSFDERLLLQVLRNFSEAPKAVSSQFMKKWYEFSEKHLESFPSSFLAESVKLIALFKYVPPTEWSKKWLTEVENKIFEFGPTDLAATINKLRMLKLPSFRKSFGHRVEAAILAKLKNMDVSQVNDLNHGLGFTDYYFSLDLMKQIEKKNMSLLPEFNQMQFFYFLISFVNSGYRPTEQTMDLWEKLAMNYIAEGKVPNRLVASSIYTFALMVERPSKKFLEVMLNQLDNNLDALEALDVSRMIHVFYLLRLDRDYPEFFDKLIARVPHLDMRDSRRIKNELYVAAKYYQLVVKDSRLIDSLNFEVEKRGATFKRVTGRSLYEQEMAKELDRDGVQYEEQYLTSIGFPVDFYIPQKRLIIQVDGVFHFITDMEGKEFFKLKDVRFNEMHEAAGYKIERVHYSKFK